VVPYSPRAVELPADRPLTVCASDAGEVSKQQRSGSVPSILSSGEDICFLGSGEDASELVATWGITPDDYRIWPLRDRRWVRLSKPLVAFLRTSPRSWKELKVWSKTNQVPKLCLRHMLAFLEDRKFAETQGTSKSSIRWLLTDEGRSSLLFR